MSQIRNTVLQKAQLCLMGDFMIVRSFFSCISGVMSYWHCCRLNVEDYVLFNVKILSAILETLRYINSRDFFPDILSSLFFPLYLRITLVQEEFEICPTVGTKALVVSPCVATLWCQPLDYVQCVAESQLFFTVPTRFRFRNTWLCVSRNLPDCVCQKSALSPGDMEETVWPSGLEAINVKEGRAHLLHAWVVQIPGS